jgi:hypothetical protein
MRIDHRTLTVAVLALAASAPAMAYVGPGAGLTLLSALWGLLVAVLAAVAFLVVWPIRRWRRRRQAALETGTDSGSEHAIRPENSLPSEPVPSERVVPSEQSEQEIPFGGAEQRRTGTGGDGR